MTHKTLFTLILLVFVSSTSALEMSRVVVDLESSNYATRIDARNDLTAAFAMASAPESDADILVSLEAAVIAQVESARLSPENLRYMILMLEQYGGERSVEAMYPLLKDADSKTRDSARRALTAIPGESSVGYLLEGLKRSSGEEKIAFIDALASKGGGFDVSEIVALLDSSDVAVVIGAAKGLALIKDKSAVPALSKKLKTASDGVRPALESALIEIGLDSMMAADLALSGSRFSIRSSAYEQLLRLDSEKALELIQKALNRSDFDLLTDLVKSVMEGNVKAAQEAVVAQIERMPEELQILVVSAIGEYQRSAYEAEILALIPDASGLLQATIVDTLGTIGTTASFDALFKVFLENPRDANVSNALARLNAPSVDKEAFEVIETSSDPSARISSMKVLELRNIEGATDFLNEIVRNETDPKIIEAAFESLEVIGDVESIQILIGIIKSESSLLRSAQRSLKRLSLNYGLADLQWEKAYQPALSSAASDEIRERFVVILDGIPGSGSLDYLRNLVLGPDSALRPSALRMLRRWPTLDVGDVWVDLASAQGTSEEETVLAEKELTKLLKPKGWVSDKQQISLAVRAIQAAPNVEFKQAILSIYAEPNPRQALLIKTEFQVLKEDPEIRNELEQLLRN